MGGQCDCDMHYAFGVGLFHGNFLVLILLLAVE